MHRAFLPLALATLGAAPADEAARLVAAKRAAVVAQARAERLTVQAAAERDAADRAAAEERALRARVTAAAAALTAADARVALVERRLADQRAELGRRQAPAARLLAALQSLARRPALAAVVQPGSVDDLVHLRAVLGSALPAIRERTVAVRADLAATRGLQAAARVAAQAQRDGRAVLERERATLAATEARHRTQAQALGRDAMTESDRALGLGERARDLVDRMAEADAAVATAGDLARLSGPIPRPLAPRSAPPAAVPGVYRLPVTGRLVTGLGAMADAGFRARGLTFAVADGTGVVAPAGGTVRYAGRFRSFGGVVIIDHGDGWTTLVSGLAVTPLVRGQTVAAGAEIGRAGGDEPRVTVELRRRGRPVDLLALVG